MHHRLSISRGACLKFGLFAALVAASVACRKPEPEPAPPPAQPAPLTAEKPVEQPAAPAPAPTSQNPYTTEPAPTFDADHPWLGPGWGKLSLQDTLPICAFAGFNEREAALHIEQVKKQSLKADSTVVFGVYGPGCLNKECDARANLQCWVDLEGDTLHVHTRFSSFHKDGSTCTKDCLEVDAACETPALKAGKYTVQHGEKSYKLQIPSLVRQPCFDSK
jgi:hypothetical protein